jgi:glycerol-3-phosphate O-acyltransferase/dihydroxyacetone phosphate acyltransferase
VRTALRALFRLTLRIFFRRMEVIGIDRVPAEGPVIFVLNHPNGLVDPALLLCLAPRRVSFLAKAPLFRMPVVGALCRGFDAIPVYRRQDEGTDPRQNRETFDTARRVLAGGGAIAIFPEGASHGDSQLRPLKTGTARIALGAAAALGRTTPVRIVPATLYYRAKQTFRSSALLFFGDPLTVPPMTLAPGAEPPVEPVRALTAQIAAALAALTLQAEHAEALSLVQRAQRIFSTQDEPPDATPPLAAELEVRLRFAAGLPIALARWPDRFTAIRARVERYENTLRSAGLDPRHITPSYGVKRVARYVLQSGMVFLLLLPVALVGALIHYPAYRVVGYLATGATKRDEESLATAKVLGGMLLFPLTWGGVAALLWLRFGVTTAMVALAVMPLLGFAALLFFERLDRTIGRARALGLFLFRRRAFLRLVAERRAIRSSIMALGRDVGVVDPLTADTPRA